MTAEQNEGDESAGDDLGSAATASGDASGSISSLTKGVAGALKQQAAKEQAANATISKLTGTMTDTGQPATTPEAVTTIAGAVEKVAKQQASKEDAATATSAAINDLAKALADITSQQAAASANVNESSDSLQHIAQALRSAGGFTRSIGDVIGNLLSGSADS
jgi:chromosome segregation ATPase